MCDIAEWDLVLAAANSGKSHECVLLVERAVKQYARGSERVGPAGTGGIAGAGDSSDGTSDTSSDTASDAASDAQAEDLDAVSMRRFARLRRAHAWLPTGSTGLPAVLVRDHIINKEPVYAFDEKLEVRGWSGC